MTLDAICREYRALRKKVYEEATRPEPYSASLHAANKKKFRQSVEEICAKAHLDHYQRPTPEARRALWHHLWTKIRYAGFKADFASREIDAISSVFDQYEAFAEDGWNFPDGDLTQNFLTKSGQFSGLPIAAKKSKLKMIIDVARKYVCHFKSKPECNAIGFIDPAIGESDVWKLHWRLVNDVGYRADLTALHFMMDVGFPVVKPDIILSRAFVNKKWLWKVPVPFRQGEEIPQDLSTADLEAKGVYKLQYHYTKPRMYRRVINCAREIVENLKEEDLKKDIGWCTSNMLREFDLFVVKAGQVPEPDFGIVRTIEGHRPAPRMGRGSKCPTSSV